MSDVFKPEKLSVARSFGQSALHYDDVAVLQKQTGDELLDRLSLVTLSPKRILDLGAGTGRNVVALTTRYPDAEVIGLDIAPTMLQQAQKTYRRSQGLKRWLPKQKKPVFIAGDAEHLPLADNSVDLVFANLALQWCDLAASFAEIERVLQPDGLLMFTTLGPDTLHELRAAWASVDNYPHVNVFYDMHDVGEAMLNARLAEPVLDMDRYVLTYQDALAMMRDLKVLGASNVAQGRRRGLTGKKALAQVTAAYEPFREQGLLPASYEVIFGHAWAGVPASQIQQGDGSVSIPLSELTGLSR
ncbi:MAG: malonyl-ACP O-methyltransferase BioC [Piscirickettsiaceae bacterium]|jgi:malonyl-CoA O-methyltransferase|nr:malonyl-ACP O-methyltransferase BioC [Piscirickettsiaceae bacterium]